MYLITYALTYTLTYVRTYVWCYAKQLQEKRSLFSNIQLDNNNNNNGYFLVLFLQRAHSSFIYIKNRVNIELRKKQQIKNTVHDVK